MRYGAALKAPKRHFQIWLHGGSENSWDYDELPTREEVSHLVDRCKTAVFTAGLCKEVPQSPDQNNKVPQQLLPLHNKTVKLTVTLSTPG